MEKTHKKLLLITLTILFTLTIIGSVAADSNITNGTTNSRVMKNVTNLNGSQDTINYQDNINYTVTIKRTSGSQDRYYRVNDTLPVGLQYLGYSATHGTYNSTTGMWTVIRLSNGESAILRITAKVTNSSTSFNNTAIVQSSHDGNSGWSSVGTAWVNFYCPAAAHVILNKTVNNPTPNYWSLVTYTITALNNGPNTAAGLQVTDLLPAGLTYISHSASAGTYTSGTGLWNIGTLIKGANAVLNITANVTGTGTINNWANVTNQTTYDPLPWSSANATIKVADAAHVTLTKIVSNPTPNYWSLVTYTITAHNNGPNTAAGLQVTDLLPAGLTYVSHTASQGTYTSGTGLWNIGTLTFPGTDAILQIVANVTGTGTINNWANVTNQTTYDPLPWSSANATIKVADAAHVTLTKIVSNPTPNYWSLVTYTITAHNNGPNTAAGLQVTDLLPAGLTYVSHTASQGTYTSGTGLWNIGTLTFPGTDAILQIVANVTGTGTINNWANVTNQTTYDPLPWSSANATIKVADAAHVTLTKIVSNPTPNYWSLVTYTITAHNNGPNTAAGLQVTDLLPAGLTYVSHTASQGTYTSGTGLWNIGTLTFPGTDAILQIVANVTGTGTINNWANVTNQTTYDPLPWSSANATIKVADAAHVTLTKIVSNPTPNYWSLVTYTITAHNNGPNTAAGLQVTDLLPAGLTYVSHTASQGTYTSGTGLWNIGTLTFPGTDAILQIVANVTGTGTINNWANVTNQTTYDPLPWSSANATIKVADAAHVTLTKIVSNPTPNYWSLVTYTITAHNNGPNTAAGLQVTDLLPAGLTYVSHTASQGTYTSGTGLWNIGTLTFPGTDAILQIVANVTGTGTINNWANVTNQTTYDPLPWSSANATIKVADAAHVTLTKIVSNPTPNYWSLVTYTITAHNNGPNTAAGLQVTDLLPAGLTYVSHTASQGTYTSGTGLWNIGTLTFPGTDAILQIVANVTGTGTINNWANVTNQTTYDPLPWSSANATIKVADAAHVTLTKIVSNPTPNYWSLVTYTITAHNNGPNTAAGLQVTDLLPAGLTYVSHTASQGTYTSGTGLWNIGTLTFPGTDAILQIVANVTGTGTINNWANVTNQTTYDPLPWSSANATIKVADAAHVTLTKIVSNPTPNYWSLVTYTITAHNNGPNTAAGLQVTDLLPAGLTYVSHTASQGTYTSGTGLWNIGTLTFPGTDAILQIVANVTGTGTINNWANVTNQTTYDPLPWSSANATIKVADAAHVTLTKIVSNPTPNYWSLVTYTITAHNNGPNTAAGLQVTDLLPAGLTYVSHTASQGTYTSGTGLWNIGTLTFPGTDAILQIVANVTGTGTINNWANVTNQTTYDPLPWSSANATIKVADAAHVTLTKIVSNPTPNYWSLVTYTITAHNNGPNTAAGLQVTDLLPAGLTYVSHTASQGTYTSGTGLWNIGTLTFPGTDAILQIVANVTGTGTINNWANVTNQTTYDPLPWSSANATIKVADAAHVTLTKIVSNPTPNYWSLVTYTITAHNNGPNTAAGLQVTDLLPAGLTYVSHTASQGTYTSGTGLWNIGTLTFPGTDAILQIVANVTGTGTINNWANVTNQTTYDPLPWSSANATIKVADAAHVTLTKIVSNPTPNYWSLVTYTITAHNNGPNTAAGLQVTDLLPAGLTYVSHTASQGTYTSGTGLWNIGTLTFPGTDAILQIVANVTGTGTINNWANVTNQTTYDPLPWSSANATIKVADAAHVTLTKIVSNPTPNYWSLVTYTITAHNNGPNTAAGLQVTDLLPAGLTYVSHTASQGTYTSGTGLWNIGTLTFPGTDAILQIVANVTGTGTINNWANVTNQTTYDPLPWSSANATIKVADAAHVTLTKIVSNPTPNYWSLVTYTITAHNNGPNTAAGLQVTDLLPAGLTYVSHTASQGTYTSGTGLWNIGTLTFPGTDAILQIVANVTGTGTINNWANVTNQTTYDPLPWSSANATIKVADAAHVTLTKIVSNPTPNYWSLVTYTITAHNNGPNTAAGLQVTDLLPAGLTYVSHTASQGTYTSGTGLWNIGTLTFPGTDAILQIVANVTGTGTINNWANVTNQTTYDPLPWSSANATIKVADAAHVTLTKIVSNPTPNYWSLVTYTITAHNNGPNTAAGLQVTDLLPAGLTYVSHTASQGTYTSGTGLWNIGTLTFPGTDAILQIVANVTGTGTINNWANVTNQTTYDPLPWSSANATIKVADAAHVTLTKIVSNPTPNYWSLVTYTITAHNNGPNTAAGLQVTDLLPAGLTYVSHTASQGTYTSGTGLWNIGTLTFPGTDAILQIVANVTGTGTINNWANVTNQTTYDPLPWSSANATINVRPVAFLVISKVANPVVLTVGQLVTFTIKVTNYGPDTSKNTYVTEKLPTGLAYQSHSTTMGTYNSGFGIWTTGDLAAGNTAILNLTALVQQTGSYINTATVGSDSYNPNIGNNTSNATVTVESPVNPNGSSTVNVEAAEKTIPLQKTGLPVAYVALAVLMLLAGYVIPKRR